ncbi:MAG: hypothetical protein CYPHOPRED_004441 [Cyphobasidiales sp. Tagirdzhanova-0007]|nr:MAG: hypothetical protein CYPHOPRED_004441 [Cyphobasidiales sp. Tagirdzhanova-0007]
MAPTGLPKRIIKETERLVADSPPGISAVPHDDNLRYFDVIIEGPNESPFERGKFKLELFLPEEYPMGAPKVRFLTKIYHPNIDKLGRICLDILKDKWSPALQIRTVLLSIQALLSAPNPDDPLNNECAQHYKENEKDAKRGFLGLGEVLGVLTNPSEMVRSLTESKKLLDEARQDLKDMRERAQMPPKHTFSPLPGFFERKEEVKAIERALSGVPTFNVLFGASSVGKTALCRQVLCQPHFHVLHFDLRIAGFADLSSLYFALTSQMEQYFVDLSKRLAGYQDFEKESFAFKHDRLAIQKRVEGGGEVKTSDVAHILELFQSALLKYWSFEPATNAQGNDKVEKQDKPKTDSSLKDQRSVDVTSGPHSDTTVPALPDALQKSSATKSSDVTDKTQTSLELPPKKLVPVIFFDEAHRLPLLIRDKKAMKCILDAMLVLTKQDRLIHVIHATSDPFYMHWLRQLNIMQHCKIMSVGDASYEETRAFYTQNLLPDVSEALRPGLSFDTLFEIFGGKLAHLSDYVADYVNADGKLTAKQSSHYAQAHALLNLQLIHAAPGLSSSIEDEGDEEPSGFRIYSPITSNNDSDSENGKEGSFNDFTPRDLLTVCKRMLRDKALPYFPLCRELGARAVDGLVRGRILELRWVETITPEYDIEQSVKETGPLLLPTTPVIRAAMRQVLEEWKDYLPAETAPEKAKES